MAQRAFDYFGNLALVKFADKASKAEKVKFGKKLLKENKSIKTVLEKSGKFSGRLRKLKTKHLVGEKTKEVLYKENGCVFRFNIDSTYFSPRLSNERKDIASKIRKGENVLVMFAGVAPFSVVIARNSDASRIVSNEINREANKYAKLNLELNHVNRRVELLPGDIKKAAEKLKDKFDVIVMPRPRLKDSFLESAFLLSKKGTRIYYYDFCKVDEVDKIVARVKEDARVAKKKIRITRVKPAGEIAPYKIRVRVDFVVV